MSEFENKDTVWKRKWQITLCQEKDGRWYYHYCNGRGAFVSSYGGYESLELCCNRLIDRFEPKQKNQTNE